MHEEESVSEIEKGRREKKFSEKNDNVYVIRFICFFLLWCVCEFAKINSYFMVFRTLFLHLILKSFCDSKRGRETYNYTCAHKYKHKHAIVNDPSDAELILTHSDRIFGLSQSHIFSADVLHRSVRRIEWTPFFAHSGSKLKQKRINIVLWMVVLIYGPSVDIYG